MTPLKDNRVKPIVILNPINLWGKLAFRIMKFAGWLYRVTGNEWKNK